MENLTIQKYFTMNFAKSFLQVDAFPGDIIIFSRVINLLRGIILSYICMFLLFVSSIWYMNSIVYQFTWISGLSSTMDLRIVYVDIMRPFAESVLHW